MVQRRRHTLGRQVLAVVETVARSAPRRRTPFCIVSRRELHSHTHERFEWFRAPNPLQARIWSGGVAACGVERCIVHCRRTPRVLRSERGVLYPDRDARPTSRRAAPRPSSSARRWHSPQDAIKRKRYDLSVGDFEQARAVRALLRTAVYERVHRVRPRASLRACAACCAAAEAVRASLVGRCADLAEDGRRAARRLPLHR